MFNHFHERLSSLPLNFNPASFSTKSDRLRIEINLTGEGFARMTGVIKISQNSRIL